MQPLGGERPLLKCVVLGTSNVGKTSLLAQFVEERFTPGRRVTTGADFATKAVTVGGESVRLAVWDTAGQERFYHGTLGAAFYRGADAAVLVYDTSNFASFDQLELWRAELLQRVEAADEFPIVVVGNKIDLPNPNREAELEVVTKWCRSLGMGLWLTSAKEGTGVRVAMEAVALLALENRKRRPARRQDAPGVKLQWAQDRGQVEQCC